MSVEKVEMTMAEMTVEPTTLGTAAVVETIALKKGVGVEVTKMKRKRSVKNPERTTEERTTQANTWDMVAQETVAAVAAAETLLL